MKTPVKPENKKPYLTPGLGQRTSRISRLILSPSSPATTGKLLALSKIHLVSALPKTVNGNAKVMGRVIRLAYGRKISLESSPAGDLSGHENPEAADWIRLLALIK